MFIIVEIFIIFSIFGQIHLVHVRCCGNIYYIFGQVHHVNVHRCQLLGHVEPFWSYSFSHLD